MLEIAVVSLAGVGGAYVEAYSFPVTCVDLANVLPASTVRENPVRPVAEMGLTPTSQLIEEGGTVETPDLDRMAKVPATPRTTGGGPRATAELFKRERQVSREAVEDC